LTTILTIEILEKLPASSIFAYGEAVDSPEGINMTESGKMLRWVAKTGAINDWCIYCHWADNSWVYVMEHGDKVCDPKNIQRIMPCTDSALAKYRY